MSNWENGGFSSDDLIIEGEGAKNAPTDTELNNAYLNLRNDWYRLLAYAEKPIQGQITDNLVDLDGDYQITETDALILESFVKLIDSSDSSVISALKKIKLLEDNTLLIFDSDFVSALKEYYWWGFPDNEQKWFTWFSLNDPNDIHNKNYLKLKQCYDYFISATIDYLRDSPIGSLDLNGDGILDTTDVELFEYIFVDSSTGDSDEDIKIEQKTEIKVEEQIDKETEKEQTEKEEITTDPDTKTEEEITIPKEEIQETKTEYYCCIATPPYPNTTDKVTYKRNASYTFYFPPKQNASYYNVKITYQQQGNSKGNGKTCDKTTTETFIKCRFWFYNNYE